MENKLGRKNMLEWSETVQKVTDEMYKQAFYEGYNAAKNETPDVKDMANLLADRYTGEELSEMLLTLAKVRVPSIVKSANEQRAKLIQRAREFVEEQKTIQQGKEYYISPCFLGFWCNANFVVNTDKRTIVCLLKSASGTIRSKGISKCYPNEVFNTDIGKAIALARALEIDVPKEFMRAVQPDEILIGMKVQPTNQDTGKDVGEVCEVANYRFSYPGFKDGRYASSYKIIDDTKAQYQEAIKC